VNFDDLDMVDQCALFIVSYSVFNSLRRRKLVDEHVILGNSALTNTRVTICC
jgi:hypothetical protein